MSDTASTVRTDDTEQKLESRDGTRKPSEVVERWLKELAAADTHERDWRVRADTIMKLYRDEREKNNEGDGTTHARRFNILYSNTEVLRGALYSNCPVPDVRRRFLDKEHAARVAALVLNRALVALLDRQNDGEDFDSLMKSAVFDMIVPGRGVARVKYVPTISKFQERVAAGAPPEGEEPAEDLQQDENGYFRVEEREEVVYEAVEPDYVEWSMFRYSPAKRWKKVRWVAFGELLTRDDLITQFGEKVGKAVEMKWMPKGMTESDENAIFKRALVWTIWNKTQKKCIVVSEGYKEAPLSEVDDPLGLQDFFPVPRPLYSIFTTDTLIPTPEYAIYQDHALQLDEIEERIAALTQALRFRGVRDASIEELELLATAGDNKFVPIKKYREFTEKGGLEQAFQALDISELASVIVELTKQAESKKAQIYEIIGISDIMRGASKAQETLGAQKIKNQWGSIRVGPRQSEVQRFARDLIRIQAEIIAEHFSPQTLAQMTGIDMFFSAAEKEQAKLVVPAGQPPGASDVRFLRPTWEEVMQILRSDKLRGFKIDIETDSTIKPQADEEQKNRVELITAVTGYLEKAWPAVSQGVIPKKFATELLMFGVRAFSAGPQIEELLDEWAGGALDGEQGQAPDPAKEAAAAEQKAQAEHANALRAIELQTATANMVKAKAQAYGELVKAENLEPGMQMEMTRKRAALAGVLDPAAAATPAQGGAPVGATVQ